MAAEQPDMARQQQPRWQRLGSSLLLLRCRQRRLDIAVTVVIVGGLLLSRFALLASGPWEWDETLFAHGLVKFSLSAHFPHPPGFPGWLALGHLLLPFTGNPLLALQLVSAFLSVVALWPLASLGRRVAPPAIALLAALLVLLLPGPWLHAVRGFSSTAATTVALLAAALAAESLEGRRLSLFSVLVTCAFLIRPILLPGLAVLWLGAVWRQRPLRRLLPGLGLSLAMVGVATAVMARAEGGWQLFVDAFTSHGSRHFSRLVDNPGGWSELGLVKGLGGSLPAALLLVVAAVGLGVWAKRVGRRSAVLWLLVLVVVAVQLVWLQNRTYTRYPVPLQLALAPLIAATAGLAPPLVAGGGLLLVAGGFAWQAYPLLEEQHDTLLPGWQAVETGVAETTGRHMSVVVEAPLYPYASYRLHWAGGGELPGDPRLVLSPWAPEPWTEVFDRPYLVVTDHPERYLAPLVGGERRFAGVSERLQPFTQERCLAATVLSNPPLPVHGWWQPEHLSSGESFMWGTIGAELVLPPLPSWTRVALDLRPAGGPAPLRIVVDGRVVATIDGSAPRHTCWLTPQDLDAAGAHSVVLQRDDTYPPGGKDSRRLAVQLFGARAIGPGLPWQGLLVSEDERRSLQATVDGAYTPETFGSHGRACWLRSQARLRLPAGEGTLSLRLWAPRPKSPYTRVLVGGRQVLGPLQIRNRPTEIAVPITATDVVGGFVTVELESVPYVPAEAGHGNDHRDLGVVLQAARFRPPPDTYRPWGWLDE